MSSYTHVTKQKGPFTLTEVGQINTMESCKRVFEQFVQKFLAKSTEFILHNSTPTATAGFETLVGEAAH